MESATLPRKAKRRKAPPRKPGDEGWNNLQHQRAAELTALTRGKVKVRYCPGGREQDEDYLNPNPSIGHLFEVSYGEVDFSVDEADYEAKQVKAMWLDSRKGPLRPQLIAELTRVANVYLGFAGMVRQSLPIQEAEVRLLTESELMPLKIAIVRSGKVVNFHEVPDPRIGVCRSFNSMCPDGSSTAMPAEVKGGAAL